MEYENENKLGGGVIAVAVLHFIANALTLITVVAASAMKDKLAETYKSMGIEAPSEASYIVDGVIAVLIIVSLILLLMKKKIGVYGYFGSMLVSIIVTIAFQGFKILSIILTLILPVIMFFLLKDKKELFN